MSTHEPSDETQTFEAYAEPDEPAEPAYPSFWEQPDQVVVEKKRGRFGRFLAWMLAVLLGAAGGVGGTWYAVHEGVIKPRAAAAGVNVVAPPVKASGAAPFSQVTAVARALLPSVVRVDVTGPTGSGIGSGVIYRADGYIVTNLHVVQGASSVRVDLSTGDRLDATVVASASAVDISVLKVARTGLPAATFGSTRDLEVGDLAVAIGSPFGLSSTVTAGVISALHRNELASQQASPDLVQTDAPINPGNSGGALANARGEVIGINEIIASSSGGSEGVGFAIPIDLVRKVADQIIATGHATLPKLGVGGADVPDDGGALVQQVESGGPAASAGIKVGDMVVGFDGQRVTSMGSLIALILEKEPGNTVTIDLDRNGSTVTVRATLGTREAG